MKNQKTGQKSIFNFKHYKILQEQFGNFHNCSFFHFCSFNQWHSYELLLYLLSITNKSDVIITTFGLSEEGIRALMKAKDVGYINNITVIINSVSRKYKDKLLFFLDSIEATIYLSNVHLKVFLIKNEQNQIIVNQSANFSRNPTIESGFISNDIKIYNIYSNFVQKIIEKSLLWGKKNNYK